MLAVAHQHARVDTTDTAQRYARCLHLGKGTSHPRLLQCGCHACGRLGVMIEHCARVPCPPLPVCVLEHECPSHVPMHMRRAVIWAQDRRTANRHGGHPRTGRRSRRRTEVAIRDPGVTIGPALTHGTPERIVKGPRHPTNNDTSCREAHARQKPLTATAAVREPNTREKGSKKTHAGTIRAPRLGSGAATLGSPPHASALEISSARGEVLVAADCA